MSIWPTFAVACIPAAGALIANLVINKRTLSATQPKTDAEADLAQATANATNIQAQGYVISRLEAEVKRLEGRLAKTEETLAKTSDALNEMREHARMLESSLVDEREQNAVLAAQLAQSEADRKVLMQQNAILVEQNRILVEQNLTLTDTLRLVAHWLRDNYANGFPEGVTQPPDLTRFLN